MCSAGRLDALPRGELMPGQDSQSATQSVIRKDSKVRRANITPECDHIETILGGLWLAGSVVQHGGELRRHENRDFEAGRSDRIRQVPSKVEKDWRVVGVEFRFGRHSCRASTQRNLQIHPTTGRENAEDLLEGTFGVRNMLENVRRQKDVDRIVRQVDVLEVDADISFVRGEIEITCRVGERSTHHSSIGIAETRARLEDSQISS